METVLSQKVLNSTADTVTYTFTFVYHDRLTALSGEDITDNPTV